MILIPLEQFMVKKKIKNVAKGKGEKAKQAKEIVRLNKEKGELSEMDLSEEIMELLDVLPISEMDNLIDNDPIEEVRDILCNYGLDELVDLRDELKGKVKEQNRTKTFAIRSFDYNDEFEIKAKTIEEARIKALKHYGIKIKKLKD